MLNYRAACGEILKTGELHSGVERLRKFNGLWRHVAPAPFRARAGDPVACAVLAAGCAGRRRVMAAVVMAAGVMQAGALHCAFSANVKQAQRARPLRERRQRQQGRTEGGRLLQFGAATEHEDLLSVQGPVALKENRQGHPN